MFWGCVIKDKKPHTIQVGDNKVIHLSEACLTPSAPEGKVYVQLQRGDEKYNLCVLQKDKWESHKLDHFLMLSTMDSRPYKLGVVGPSNCEVHITGYFEAEEDEDALEGDEPVGNIKKAKQVEEVKEEVKAKAAPNAPNVSKVPTPNKTTPNSTPNLKPKAAPAKKDSDSESLGLDDDMSDGDQVEIEELLNKNKKIAEDKNMKEVKLKKLDNGNSSVNKGNSSVNKGNSSVNKGNNSAQKHKFNNNFSGNTANSSAQKPGNKFNSSGNKFNSSGNKFNNSGNKFNSSGNKFNNSGKKQSFTPNKQQ